MAEPWKKYQQQTDAKPWEKYGGGNMPQAETAPTQSQQPDESVTSRLGDMLKRQLGLTARYSIEGATALPTMVGDFTNRVLNLGVRGANAIAGSDIPELGMPSQGVQNLISDLPQPEAQLERIISYPTRALAGAATMGGGALASGSKTLAPLAQGMQSQAAGAITGGLAQGGTAEFTDNPWLQLAAGVVGGALGGAALGDRTPSVSQVQKTTQQIKDEAQGLYRQVDNLGVTLTTEPLQRLQGQVVQDLTDFGYHPTLQPRIAAVIDEIGTLAASAAGSVSIKNLQTLRRVAQNAANSTDDAERALGAIIINRIDDTLETLQPTDVLTGNADEATDMLNKASSLWRNYRKAIQVEKSYEKAQRAAASSGTGGNIDNAIRQKVKSILDSESARRGFTKDEITAMESIVRGTPTTSALRLIGRFSPQTGFLPTAFGLGAAAYGGPIAALPIAGAIAKPLADMATKKNVEGLLALIRAGGQTQQKPSMINDILRRAALGSIPAAANVPPAPR